MELKELNPDVPSEVNPKPMVSYKITELQLPNGGIIWLDSKALNTMWTDWCIDISDYIERKKKEMNK